MNRFTRIALWVLVALLAAGAAAQLAARNAVSTAPFDGVGHLVERVYGIPADEWERIITRTWLGLTLTAVVIATLVLALRIPRTIVQWASFGLCFSYSMIMVRFFYIIHTGSEAIPQPWALIFWTIQALLALFFIYAILREWGPVMARRVWQIARENVARAVVALMVVVALLTAVIIAAR